MKLLARKGFSYMTDCQNYAHKKGEIFYVYDNVAKKLLKLKLVKKVK